MICPECNTPAQKGDTYCQNCGHQFVVMPVRTGVDPESGRIIPGTVIAPGGQVIPTSPPPVVQSAVGQTPVSPVASDPTVQSTAPLSPLQASSQPDQVQAPVAAQPQPLAPQSSAPTGPDPIFHNRPTVSDEQFMSAGVAAGRERQAHSRHKAVNAIIGTLIVLALIGSAYFIGFHTNLFGLGQPDEPTYSLPLEGTPAVTD